MESEPVPRSLSPFSSQHLPPQHVMTCRGGSINSGALLEQPENVGVVFSNAANLPAFTMDDKSRGTQSFFPYLLPTIFAFVDVHRMNWTTS